MEEGQSLNLPKPLSKPFPMQEEHSHEQLKSLRNRVESMKGHGVEKREQWVQRASELLHTLFATFPGLPHTKLAQFKIEHNRVSAIGFLNRSAVT
jgi:hypothetical protein